MNSPTLILGCTKRTDSNKKLIIFFHLSFLLMQYYSKKVYIFICVPLPLGCTDHRFVVRGLEHPLKETFSCRKLETFYLLLVIQKHYKSSL